jgi:hypothetical protein
VTGRLRTLAPVLDAVCIVAFVVIGRDTHGIGSGLTWFLTVVWPFHVGWFAVALAVRLYTSASKPWLRLAGTWSLGIAAALVLRAVLTHRESLSTFTIVVYVFLGAVTFGWRGIAAVVRRVRSAGEPAPTSPR